MNDRKTKGAAQGLLKGTQTIPSISDEESRDSAIEKLLNTPEQFLSDEDLKGRITKGHNGVSNNIGG